MRLPTYNYKGKSYRMDRKGFLLCPEDWDEDFAAGQATKAGLAQGLSARHWRVIRFIRNMFDRMGTCPLLYVACRENQLDLGALEELFPTGYLDGACRLAGVTYRSAYIQHSWMQENWAMLEASYRDQVYPVDVRGFLEDPSTWDACWAVHRAHDAKMPEDLTPEHFEIISYLRETYWLEHAVPAQPDCCQALTLAPRKVQSLFPDGYYGGAVRLAGLPLHGPAAEHATHTISPAAVSTVESIDRNRISSEHEGEVNRGGDRPSGVERPGLPDSCYTPEAPAIETRRSRAYWDAIDYVCEDYARRGVYPGLRDVCDRTGVRADDLRGLFPEGYGAHPGGMPGSGHRGSPANSEPGRAANRHWAQGGLTRKIYRTDVRGFLVDPVSWDEPYAICRAREWKMPGRELTDRQWQVIYFLRERFRRSRVVPTVYATCKAHGIDIQELEHLFPDGYHRGAVKIAGLCSL